MGDILEKYCKKLEKEKEELKSIIKEVREYVDKGIYCEYGDFAYKSQQELLEILDKDSDKE